MTWGRVIVVAHAASLVVVAYLLIRAVVYEPTAVEITTRVGQLLVGGILATRYHKLWRRT